MTNSNNSVKLFNGTIYHKRIGNIDHFFKNRINALLIDLKKKDENFQEKFPTFFSFTKFNILSSWVVRQFENEFNPTHWHGGHISGAGFLKVPKNLGKINQDKTQTKYKGGSLQFTHGARMFLSQSIMTVVPKVGDFYFFPNYLMHHVYPFRDTKEERRSISFNAEIDEGIFDVYGKK